MTCLAISCCCNLRLYQSGIRAVVTLGVCELATRANGQWLYTQVVNLPDLCESRKERIT